MQALPTVQGSQVIQERMTAKWVLLETYFPGGNPLQRQYYAVVFSTTRPLLLSLILSLFFFFFLKDRGNRCLLKLGQITTMYLEVEDISDSDSIFRNPLNQKTNDRIHFLKPATHCFNFHFYSSHCFNFENG